MSEDAVDRARETVDAVYRNDSRRVLATLIRLLGDFDLAEEAMHDAFAAAVDRWPRDGIPENPRAWLVSTGRFKAIDGMRRRARFDASLVELAERLTAAANGSSEPEDESVEDDRLRLIFTCCHPALPPDAQIALTLREVCGLTTEEIARAFLTPAPTLAQRIVRAKTKIRAARIPYQVPSVADLPDRLDTVLHVIYLVFNEGYSASSGASLTRHDLSTEAIRLGKLLVELLPEPEARGLLALMLLHEARRPARTSAEGELVLLDEQDRSLWNRGQIAEGTALVERALSSRRFGPYTLQAAIAAVHAEAPSAQATDWAQIVGLYDVLLRADPSPVVELNRAAALAMRDGPLAGLQIIDPILARGDLVDYHLAHSARADLCRRLGRTAEARVSVPAGAGPDPAGARATVSRTSTARLLTCQDSALRRRTRIVDAAEADPAYLAMLIPAIDLQDGAVVQLVQGERLAIRDDDVFRWVRRFEKCPKVQVIDLDAAMGRGDNLGLVRQIAGALSCRVGGGVRTIARARDILAAGAKQVIAGSSLFRDGKPDLEFAKELADAVGLEQVIAAVDSRAGRVVIHGWKTPLPLTAIEAVKALEPYCGEFLYTHVDTEGLMAGTNLDAILEVRRATGRRLTAAGGITTQQEIDALDTHSIDAVVGMALYTGRIAIAPLIPPGSVPRLRDSSPNP